jgi:hypothetical protein
MNITPALREDTPAWMLQVWIGFVTSIAMMTYGILNLQVDFWVRGYLGMGLLFVVSACLALAKMLRDQQEQRFVVRQRNQAKTEQILGEFEARRG